MFKMAQIATNTFYWLYLTNKTKTLNFRGGMSYRCAGVKAFKRRLVHNVGVIPNYIIMILYVPLLKALTIGNNYVY